MENEGNGRLGDKEQIVGIQEGGSYLRDEAKIDGKLSKNFISQRPL